MYILFLCLLYYWPNLDFNISSFSSNWVSVVCVALVLGTVGYRSNGHRPHPQYIDSLQSHDRLKDSSSKFVTKLCFIATCYLVQSKEKLDWRGLGRLCQVDGSWAGPPRISGIWLGGKKGMSWANQKQAVDQAGVSRALWLAEEARSCESWNGLWGQGCSRCYQGHSLKYRSGNYLQKWSSFQALLVRHSRKSVKRVEKDFNLYKSR